MLYTPPIASSTACPRGFRKKTARGHSIHKLLDFQSRLQRWDPPDEQFVAIGEESLYTTTPHLLH